MKSKLLVSAVVAAALVTAACTSDDEPTPTEEPTTPAVTATATAESTAEATTTPTEAAANPQTAQSTLIDANPEFNYGAAVWQGYWLSRDHFGPFVMGSGLGIPFQPPMDALSAAMGMVGQNPDDPISIPTNLAPLQAIFTSGSAALVNDPRDFGPLDFEAFRLDPATFDQTVGVRGQAQTMLKESQWARNFANPHFGTPDGDFGAQQRFIGVMVNMLAQMQGRYAMEQLATDDGLYADSDGELDYLGNWVLLHAFSDIAGIAAEDGTPYTNPDMAAIFDGAATDLYNALLNREPESAAEAATAIRALVFRAYTTSDGSLRDEALARAQSIAGKSLVTLTTDGAVESFAAIAGLISAYAIDQDASYLDPALELFANIEPTFDRDNGVFEGISIYTVDDVAWILGGLNSLILQGDKNVQAAVIPTFVAFFESTLDLSGMQLSAPPGKNGAMAGTFEQTLPSVVFYHGADTPPPPMAGALPIPAREITWDGSAWTVTDSTFETAGSMHLANELNWLGPHLGALLFPPIEN